MNMLNVFRKRAYIGGVVIGACVSAAALVGQSPPGNLRPFGTVGPIDVPGKITVARETSLTEVRARLNTRAAERARESAARARQFRAAIRQAGGLERYLERARTTAVEAGKRAGAGGGSDPNFRDAEAHLRAINEALTHMRLCNKPWVWNQSETKTKSFTTGLDDFAYNLNYAVTPGNTVFLTGCDFGTTPGTVQLRLKTTGEVITLQTQHPSAYWEDKLIAVFFPKGIVGVPDQQAELLVADSHNVVSDPMIVDFFAERDVQRLDTDAHRNLIEANDACFTAATEDFCGGVTKEDNPLFAAAAGFVGKHHKQCCNSVTSTDSMYIKLRNGWEIADPDRSPYEPPKTYGGFLFPFNLSANHGYTTCDFFNDKGRVESVKVFKPAGDTYAAQIDVTWHVDWACSGVVWMGDLLIMGPRGTNYWW